MKSRVDFAKKYDYVVDNKKQNFPEVRTCYRACGRELSQKTRDKDLGTNLRLILRERVSLLLK